MKKNNNNKKKKKKKKIRKSFSILILAMYVVLYSTVVVANGQLIWYSAGVPSRDNFPSLLETRTNVAIPVSRSGSLLDRHGHRCGHSVQFLFAYVIDSWPTDRRGGGR